MLLFWLVAAVSQLKTRPWPDRRYVVLVMILSVKRSVMTGYNVPENGVSLMGLCTCKGTVTRHMVK